MNVTASLCPLNFSKLPYEPSSECLVEQEKQESWVHIRTTRCCANVLNVLSSALALQAPNEQANIFINQTQWQNCSGPFRDQQPASIDSCGLHGFFSGNTPCSSLKMWNVTQVETFQDVLVRCIQFNGPSYDHSCNDCKNAIATATDKLTDQLHVKGIELENGICSMALVTTVVAKMRNGSSSVMVDDLYRCLPTPDGIMGKNHETLSPFLCRSCREQRRRVHSQHH